MFCFLNFHNLHYYYIIQAHDNLFAKKCLRCGRVWWLQSARAVAGELTDGVWVDLGPNAQIGGVWNELASEAAMIAMIQERDD